MKAIIPPHTFLFDLDGTLLDTAPDFAHCLNILLAEQMKPSLNVNQMRTWVSLGSAGMIYHALGIDKFHPNFQSTLDTFLTLYEEHLGKFTTPFPGILDVLSLLNERQIPWGIVTNKSKRFAKPLLAQYPILIGAACQVYGDTLPTQKPNPAPLMFACKQLKASPTHTFYVGDSIVDAKASQHAQMPYIRAEYGYLPPDDDLHPWPPIFKSVSTPLALLSLL